MNPKTKRRIIYRVFLWCSAVTFFVGLSFALVFHFKKDTLAAKVLLKVNNLQNGEIEFSKVSFRPFINFPHVSIALQETKYFEKSSQYRILDTIPIIELEYLFLSFNLIDLIKGDIFVSQVRLDNGHIRLINYSDSTSNISNAFQMPIDTLANAEKVIDSTLKIDLDIISLYNMNITFDDLVDKSNSNYQIQSLQSSLKYNQDTIICDLNTNIHLYKFELTDKLVLVDKRIVLNTSLLIDRNHHQIFIEPSSLSFGNARFSTKGIIDLSDSAFVDLDVKGDSDDFSILNILLSNRGVENIQRGDLFFEGTITGPLFNGIPIINCSFGLNNIEIQIPNTEKKISNLVLNGHFNSGKKRDFSQAKLSITDISAQIPRGRLNGYFKMSSFNKPDLDIDIYLKGDISGFDKIIDFGGINNLQGILELSSQFKGVFDLENIENFSSKSIISMDSISFDIPKLNTFENLHGRLEFENNDLQFKEFYANYGNSDFLINGSLSNIQSLFFGEEREIIGDLHIKSNVYDFPDFFSYDMRVAKAFPYRIMDIDLWVQPKTTKSQLVQFVEVPRIEFDIKHLDAEIENFLPALTINSGYFTLTDKDSSLFLDFKDFKIDMLESMIDVDMTLNSTKDDPIWLDIDAEITNLNPKETFVHWVSDSMPDFFDGSFNGKTELVLELSDDSVDFKKLDLNAKSISFINSKDTFNLVGLEIDAVDIKYDSLSNLKKSLSFNSDLFIDEMSTNHFEVDDLKYNMDVTNGVFKVITYNNQFFDTKGDGLLILKPFEDTPFYQLTYSVKQFEISNLLASFKEDTILRGKFNLDFKLSFSTNSTENIFDKLDGHIKFYGNDIMFYGVDLDKIIGRFKRSQKFTFADVGAVLLMGPAGLIVTKGSEYTSLLVQSQEDSCRIIEFSSDWEVKNGVMQLQDVALSTLKNRIAANGFIDLPRDSININIALLNERGCSIFHQSISGSLIHTETGKLNIGKLLMAPVANLAKTVSSVDCEVFYDGKVKQPGKTN